jgi:hypothetical protein
MNIASSFLDWFVGGQNSSHAPGEVFYWFSQITLAFVASVAAFFAFNQVKAFKQFELLKYLEQQHIVEARRTMWNEIIDKVPHDHWWRENRDLERQASLVCASFNTVAGILHSDWLPFLSRFFAKHWAVTIVAQYEGLRPLIEERQRKNGHTYMGEFEWLYKRAKPHAVHYLKARQLLTERTDPTKPKPA